MGLFFGSTPPGALFNLVRTGVHAVQGTLGQNGPATSPIGRLMQLLNPAQGSTANPQGPVDPTDAGNPLNDGAPPPVQSSGGTGPYFPPTTTSYDTGGSGSSAPPPPPFNSAGTPDQLAGNAAANFISDFLKSQANASQPFSRPDEIRPFGQVAFNPTQANPNNAALHSYAAAYPMGSTLADMIAFNAKVASGAIPSWQQFTGQPAYQPPGAPAPAPALLQAFIPPGRGA